MHSTPPPPQQLGRAAARGTAVTLLAQGLRTLMQAVSLVVMARLLVPEDFGLLAMVMAVIGVADIIRDFGLSLATMRSPTLTVDQRTNLFWANLTLGLACTGLAVALTPLIVGIYDEPRLTPIVLVMSVLFTLSGFTTQFRAGLARDLQFKRIAALDIASQLVSLLTGIGLAVGGAGLWALVGQQLAAALVSAVSFAVVARWWPGLPKRGTSIRPFLSFGGGVLGTQAVGYLTKNVDTVAVGAVLGPSALGFYDRAYQTMMLPLRNINAPLTQVAVPVLAKVQEDDDRFLAYLGKSQLIGCYLTATMFAVTAGLADPLVDLVFGSAWAEAAPILAVLAVGGVFRSIGQVAYWGYLARGVSGPLFRQLLVTGSVSIALMLVGLRWGTTGVAAGHSLGAVAAWAGALWHLGRVTGVDTGPLLRQSGRTVLLVAVPCGAAAHLATLLPTGSVGQVAAGVAAAAVTFALTALSRQTRADLRTVRDFARAALLRRSGAPSRPV